MNRNLETYRSIDTHGKSQLDLLIQVYDGALAEYRAGRKAIEANDAGNCREHLEKSRRFVTHLYTTLDPEKGGGIAANLGHMYAHILQLTSEIEATKDIAKIDDIITILSNLREGWAGLKEQQQESAREAAETPDASELTDFATMA